MFDVDFHYPQKNYQFIYSNTFMWGVIKDNTGSKIVKLVQKTPLKYLNKCFEADALWN